VSFDHADFNSKRMKISRLFPTCGFSCAHRRVEKFRDEGVALLGGLSRGGGLKKKRSTAQSGPSPPESPRAAPACSMTAFYPEPIAPRAMSRFDTFSAPVTPARYLA